jgi:ribonuclease-3
MTKPIEEIIGYTFKNKDLLQKALTHSGALRSPESGYIGHYERLEFMGDAVLNLLVTEMLLERHKDDSEGDLAKRRSALVCGETISNVASELGIADYIIMLEADLATGKQFSRSILENALEALIGAIYLDSDIQTIRKIVIEIWGKLDDKMPEVPQDPKTKLQQWAQQNGKAMPTYDIVQKDGPSHDPIFTMEVKLNGFGKTSASAKSKKSAEREAALLMLAKIDEFNNKV